MIDHREPAFPNHEWENGTGGTSGWNSGLNKREYFAALALQGLAANSKLADFDHRELALLAVQQADALVVVLNDLPPPRSPRAPGEGGAE